MKWKWQRVAAAEVGLRDPELDPEEDVPPRLPHPKHTAKVISVSAFQ